MTDERRDTFEAELSAYLDGELSPGDRERVQQRLARSDDHRAMLETLREVSGQLSSLPRHRAPEELPSVMQRLAERKLLLDEEPRSRAPRVWRLFAQVAAAAAVVVACVLVGEELLTQPQTGPTAPPAMVDAGKRSTEAEDLPARGSGTAARIAAAPEAAATEKSGAGRVDSATYARQDAHASGSGDAADRSGASEDDATLANASTPRGVSRPAVAGRERARGRGPGLIAARAPGNVPEPESPAASRAGSQWVPDDAEDPYVQIQVTPLDSAEYVAMQELLREWSEGQWDNAEARGVDFVDGDGARWGEKRAGGPARLSGQKRYGPYAVDTPREHVFMVPASEIMRRIGTLNQAAPNRVRVKLSFSAADLDLLTQAALVAKATEPPKDDALRPMVASSEQRPWGARIVDAFTQFLTPPTTQPDPAGVTYWITEPTLHDEEAADPGEIVWLRPLRGPTTDHKLLELAPDQREHDEAWEKSGADTGAHTPGPFSDPDGSRRRRMHERHQAVIADPPIVIFEPIPAEGARAQPTTVPTEEPAVEGQQTYALSSLRPTSRPAAEQSLFAGLPERLFGVLIKGPSDLNERTAAAVHPGRTRVTFRVVLHPPPARDTQPGAVTLPPATQPDERALPGSD